LTKQFAFPFREKFHPHMQQSHWDEANAATFMWQWFFVLPTKCFLIF